MVASRSIAATEIRALDLPFLTQWVGRTHESSDTLTLRLAETYRATLAPHLADPEPGAAPPAIHWCLAPEAADASRIGPDGHPLTGDFLPPIPLPRRMWAGGRVELNAPLRVGDRVVRRSKIAAITHKEGRSGSLGFVTVEHELATERGVAIRERQDLVYREAASPPTGEPRTHVAATAPPGDCDEVWAIAATPVLLFRYSALTFNSHRIHYDQPYAIGVEGYAGLVVHGPLQATLLLNLATRMGGSTPRVFEYRGVAPLIAGGDFFACGRRTVDGSLRCWTQSSHGERTMEASVSW